MWKEKYIQYLRNEKNYSSHTEISYLNDLTQFEKFVVEETGEFDIPLIDSEIIRYWMSRLIEEKTAPTSVKRKLSTLKSFFKYLKMMGVVPQNPAQHIRSPKAPKRLPAFVNDSAISALLDAAPESEEPFESVRNRFLLELLYLTGMRRAELISLKTQDIDFSNKSITVTGKRNKQRIIPLSDDMLVKLKQYIEIKNKEVENISPHIFVKKDGAPMYPKLVYNIVHKQLENIPTLSRRSPHVIRHSFATEMLNNGAEINAVKELLGHSSLASTEVYTHVTFEELKKIYQKAHPRARN